MQFVMQSDRKQGSNTIHRLHNQVIRERYRLRSLTWLLASTYQHYLDLTQILSSNHLSSTAQSPLVVQQCVQNYWLNQCSRRCSLQTCTNPLNYPPAQIEQKRQKEVSCSSQPLCFVLAKGRTACLQKMQPLPQFTDKSRQCEHSKK